MSKKIEKFAVKNPTTFAAMLALLGQATALTLAIAIMR